MITVKQRETFQKKIVLDTVISLQTHPTAEEIYNRIIKTYPNISKATVYRNLNLLSESGQILKISVPYSSDHFDFNTEKHCHFICDRCKRVFDVDITVPEIDFKKCKDKGFEIESYMLLFNGICPDCKKGE